MSKIFYDHLIVLEDVEKEIAKSVTTEEDRHELWRIVDELVHHRVMGCILDKLPREHHEDFLAKFHASPHDESLIDYLKEKIDGNFDELIRQEIGGLSFELLEEIRKKK